MNTNKVISLFESTNGMTEDQIKLLEKEWLSDSGCTVSVFDETRTCTEGVLETDGTIYLLFLKNLRNKWQKGSGFMSAGQGLEYNHTLFRVNREGVKEVVCRWRQDYPLRYFNITMAEARKMALVKSDYKIDTLGFVD